MPKEQENKEVDDTLDFLKDDIGNTRCYRKSSEPFDTEHWACVLFENLGFRSQFGRVGFPLLLHC